MAALHGGKRGGRAELEVYPHLWAGVGLVRGGAGTALVGNPEQVAALMKEYAALGIDTFILSGYPHLEESYRFAELVFPLLAGRAEASASRGRCRGRLARSSATTICQRASAKLKTPEGIRTWLISISPGRLLRVTPRMPAELLKRVAAARSRRGSCRSRCCSRGSSPRAAAVLSTRVLPEPLAVVKAAWSLIQSGEMWANVKVSTWRAVSGFAIGGGIGFVLGLATGLFKPAEIALDSTMQMIRNIPALAMIPLVILWFGIERRGEGVSSSRSACFSRST